jgi:hypothetical protein
MTFEDDCERRLSMLETEVAVVSEKLSSIKNIQEATGALPITVAKWEGVINGISDDIGYLREKITAREEERKRERDEHERERKEDAKRAREEKRADRRWIIGAILTSGGLIVAALGLLLQHS